MSEQKDSAPASATPVPFKYSTRVVLKTILESGDTLGFVGQRVVVGGWVKSSKEVRKEPSPAADQPPAATVDQYVGANPGRSPSGDVSCSEILQSRIPFIRSILKMLGGGGNYSVRDKLEVSSAPRPPPPSISFLQINDGSCVSTLLVVVDSSIASPCQILHTGTCIVAEGEIKRCSTEGKHVIELKVERILHIGRVEYDKYPLSKKQLPLNQLRECPHFRPRTTTVATVMRIRSALSFAAHTFNQNNGFLCVQVPIITITDSEGFSEKFQITNGVFEKLIMSKKDEPKMIDDTENVSLDVIKAVVKEKSKIVEELKRTDSNREALIAATKDLQKTSELAAQLEAKEKSKSKSFSKAADHNHHTTTTASDNFFSAQTHLTVSGRLHLESYASSLGNVYAFGPRFRAIKTESPKQVAEMWTVEMEMAFSQLEDAMNCAEDFFKFLCKWLLEKCSEDMKFVLKRMDKNCIERLHLVILNSALRISYTEALEAMKKHSADKKMEKKLEWGAALTTEHLSYLVDEMYKRPVIIYNYPKQVKPFYVRQNDDGRTVAAFDLVVPKVGVLVSGSQNEERFNVLSTRIKELGLGAEQYEWYLDLRRHGTVKHAGFSFGFDLMVLFATGLADARDVIPFPRSYGKISN
ncbi:asparagine--tRNA ligase, cytoplasmic 2 [Cannabis sativa]|uniref:asparagine--tRNA ligase, cytoplasmic 2 n=1 Tax=Cannabis sativa TaxID=3483 RepID=UPI0029CA7C9B|nr:asparagine--tRNA ligase, cytoplasmic 2 [Cannabis sativa]